MTFFIFSKIVLGLQYPVPRNGLQLYPRRFTVWSRHREKKISALIKHPFRKNKQNKKFFHDLFYFFKNRTGSPVPSTKERPFFFFLQLYPRRFTVWSRHREKKFLTPLNIHFERKNKTKIFYMTFFIFSKIALGLQYPVPRNGLQLYPRRLTVWSRHREKKFWTN